MYLTRELLTLLFDVFGYKYLQLIHYVLFILILYWFKIYIYLDVLQEVPCLHEHGIYHGTLDGLCMAWHFYNSMPLQLTDNIICLSPLGNCMPIRYARMEIMHILRREWYTPTLGVVYENYSRRPSCHCIYCIVLFIVVFLSFFFPDCVKIYF